MFIEPTITWMPSWFSEYTWLDTKIVLKKKKHRCMSSNRIKLNPLKTELIWQHIYVAGEGILLLFE